MAIRIIDVEMVMTLDAGSVATARSHGNGIPASSWRARVGSRASVMVSAVSAGQALRKRAHFGACRPCGSSVQVRWAVRVRR
jgi:hypothetical protein